MTKQYARMTDSQWAQGTDYLPLNRLRKHDLRDVLYAILWLVRTGCQWRNIDSQFPPWKLLVDEQSVRLLPMIDSHRGIDGGKWKWP